MLSTLWPVSRQREHRGVFRLLVAKYLASKGINANRLKTQGFGESKLKNHCSDGVECTEAEHQVNRRVEFTLVLQKKEVTVK